VREAAEKALEAARAEVAALRDRSARGEWRRRRLLTRMDEVMQAPLLSHGGDGCGSLCIARIWLFCTAPACRRPCMRHRLWCSCMHLPTTAGYMAAPSACLNRTFVVHAAGQSLRAAMGSWPGGVGSAVVADAPAASQEPHVAEEDSSSSVYATPLSNLGGGTPQGRLQHQGGQAELHSRLGSSPPVACSPEPHMLFNGALPRPSHASG
jgi:hypothetical protein